ncbi:phosphoglycerate mutase family protein [Ostertagia ostertagi]
MPLVPTDLNVPNNSISEKFLDEGVFLGNPPITSFGKYYTQLTGRALCNRGLSAKLLICSPTLRSIQTAESIAKFLKADLAIEPGLIEPLAWYRSVSKKLPNFRIEELAQIYPIGASYSPIISMDALSKMFGKESEMEGIRRIDFVLRSLAGEERSESLVVVGHAITLAVAVALRCGVLIQTG